MPKQIEYTPQQKYEVIQYAKKHGKTAASKHFSVHRQSVYNWLDKEDEIAKDLAVSDATSSDKPVKDYKVPKDALSKLGSYKELLDEVGTLEERKRNLAAKVEWNLARVIDLIEKHSDLSEVHPKDLSKIMTDLNAIKKDLYNEPTVIVEYRSQWMERVLRVLTDFLEEDQIRGFVKKMQAIEADYEVL